MITISDKSQRWPWWWRRHSLRHASCAEHLLRSNILNSSDRV